MKSAIELTVYCLCRSPMASPGLVSVFGALQPLYCVTITMIPANPDGSVAFEIIGATVPLTQCVAKLRQSYDCGEHVQKQ